MTLATTPTKAPSGCICFLLFTFCVLRPVTRCTCTGSNSEKMRRTTMEVANLQWISCNIYCFDVAVKQMGLPKGTPKTGSVIAGFPSRHRRTRSKPSANETSAENEETMRLKTETLIVMECLSEVLYHVKQSARSWHAFCFSLFFSTCSIFAGDRSLCFS